MSTQNNNIPINPTNTIATLAPIIPNKKVLLMGIPGSGKTMTVNKIILNIIITKYVPTIGGKLYTYKNKKVCLTSYYDKMEMLDNINCVPFGCNKINS